MDEVLSAPTVVEYYGERDEAGKLTPHLAKVAGRLITERARSRNRRVYRQTAGWLTKAQSKIARGGVIDMRTSHQAAHEDDSLRIAGKLTHVEADGRYDGLIANTEAGRTLYTLLAGGYLRHVSLRAPTSSVKTVPIPVEEADGEEGWVYVDDLDLEGVDYTGRPGIIEAHAGLVETGAGGLLVESFEVGPPETQGERDFSADDRKKAASEGAALPDGSFPIYTQHDLDNAVRLLGHATDPAAARAHITKRAKALGLKLPDSWNSEAASSPPERETPTMDQLREAIAALVAGDTEAITAALAAHTETGGTDGEADIRSAVTRLYESVIGTSSETTTSESTTDESATDESTTDESTTDESGTDTQTEAGRAISSANMEHVQAMHDHSVAMGAQCAPMVPDTDGDGEGAPRGSMTEATTKALVTEAVQAALVERDGVWEARVAGLQAEHARQIAEIRDAKRASVATTETALSAARGPATMADVQQLAARGEIDLKDAVAAMLTASGKRTAS